MKKNTQDLPYWLRFTPACPLAITLGKPQTELSVKAYFALMQRVCPQHLIDAAKLWVKKEIQAREDFKRALETAPKTVSYGFQKSDYISPKKRAQFFKQLKAYNPKKPEGFGLYHPK